ncbi:MAG TPA: MFS transporter [Solirubrobacteraceae bacterium]|nr:MFS transporter [Solirubrobacteraceae bacterium]
MAATLAPERSSAPNRSRRMLILAICCMSLLIVGLDATIVNVALPSIAHDLHAPISGLQWTIDAYTLVLASLLMLSGSMADRFGRRRVFMLGLCLFTLASLLCSLAPNLQWLIVFRMLQGVGGSMLNPVAMSIIRNVFTDARERAQAIGLWGATVGVSFALGPVLGGALVESVGWPSIFWINIPIGLAALVLTLRFVPESKAARPRRVDPVGQILVIVLLASLTYAIIEAPSSGWLSARTLGFFAICAIATVALIAYERRREQPLLELRFFSSVPFSGATAIAVCAFAALGGFLFLNTLYLQEVRGHSPLQAGLFMLPIAGMTVICAPISGRIVGSRGARGPLIVGGCGMAISSAIMTSLSPTTPVWVLLLSYVIFGIGFGTVNPPITNTAVVGMPPSQAGVAAAIASTSRQVGQTLGVAIVGALAVGAATSALAVHHLNLRDVGWWVVLGCGVAVLGLGVFSTTRRASSTAKRVAASFGDAPLRATAPVQKGSVS